MYAVVRNLNGVSLIWIAPFIVADEDDEKLVDSSIEHHFLKLTEPWLLCGAPTILLNRLCYAPLLAAVKRRLGSGDVLLAGSGGTGKAQFQALLCKDLLTEGRTVVVDLQDGAYWCLKSGTEPRRGIRGHETQGFAEELGLKTSVYLYGARKVPGGDSRSTLAPLEVAARTVVSASPSRGGLSLDEWSNKRSGRLARKLYMPPWSLDELHALRSLDERFRGVEPALVDQMFDLFGGKVRYTLVDLLPDDVRGSTDEEVEHLRDMIEEGIGKCDAREMMAYLKSKSALTSKLDHVVHGLFTLVPRENYRKFSYSFCSRYVQDEVLKRMTDESRVCVYEPLGNINRALGEFMLPVC